VVGEGRAYANQDLSAALAGAMECWGRQTVVPGLATNLPDKQMALQAYARIMWVVEMFGDMKGQGFDLEGTMLRHIEKLSRLTLAVALLYIWSISTGTKTIRNSLRGQVDRKDRRDLGVFQIGFRIVERLLVNSLPCPVTLCVYR